MARRRLRRLVAAERPDIVHAWDGPSLAAAGAALRGDSGPALTATLADPPPARCAAAARKAAGFVVSDRAVASRLQRLGVEPARVAVAGRFALPTDPAADPGEFRRTWQIDPEAPIVAAAAHLTREANLADTIWGFELLRLLHPQAVLVIAGEGPDRHRLERQVRLMSEAASARFVSGECFSDMLGSAALFCDQGVGDRWPVEALAAVSAGVPTVATARPRTRAALADAEHGHLVAHGDRAAFGRIGDRVLAAWEQPCAEHTVQSLRKQGPTAGSAIAREIDALYARVLNTQTPLAVAGGAVRRQAI